MLVLIDYSVAHIIHSVTVTIKCHEPEEFQNPNILHAKWLNKPEGLTTAAHANGDSLKLGEADRFAASKIYIATSQITMFFLLKCIQSVVKRTSWMAYGNWSRTQDRQGAGVAAAIEQLVNQARNALFQRAASLAIVRAKGIVRSVFVRPSQVDYINGFASGVDALLL